MGTPDPEKMKANRGGSTSDQLLVAAEKLFAAHGIANVSVRAIVAEAGQKNESALHYHFGNRNGLVRALHNKRNDVVREKRRQLLNALLVKSSEPGVRELCNVLIKPPFMLAQKDEGFRNYLSVFGQFVVSTDRDLTTAIVQHEADAVLEIGLLLRKVLPQHDEDVFSARLESTARFAILSLSLFAAKDGEIVGSAAEFFFHNLLDTMTAMLTTEISEQTQIARGD